MENVKLFSHASGPSKEYVGDNAERALAVLLFGYVLDEFLERWSERSRGFEEANDEVVGNGVGVLGVGWEAVVGAAEGDLDEANGGVWREGGAELLDVERGVDKRYGVLLSLLYLDGQG